MRKFQNQNKKFKQTSIGKIPSERNVVKLKEIIIDEINGDWGQAKKDENFCFKCYVLRGTDFQNAQNGILDFVPLRYITVNSFKRRKLEVGNLLIELSGGSKDQPTGRIFIVTNEILQKSKNYLLFSNFVKKVKIDHLKCLPEFFYRYWQLIYELGKTTIYEKQTTGIRNFKYRDFIYNEKIPLPPLPIQQKIVRILDTIKDAVEVQGKIIELTKELKKSLMQDFFKYGEPSFRKGKKLKKTEIGEIPEDWEVVNLSNVCKLRKEQTLPKSDDKYIGLEHLDSGENEIKRFGIGSDVRSLKNKFYPKDILYGKLRPYLDKTVLAHFEGVCSTDLLVLVCERKKILPEYLISVLHSSKFLNFAIGTTTGTNHPRTSWENIKTFSFLLPSLPEQREIAEILQTIDQKIEIEQKKKSLYEELFRAMLNKLITGKIMINKLEI